MRKIILLCLFFFNIIPFIKSGNIEIIGINNIRAQNGANNPVIIDTHCTGCSGKPSSGKQAGTARMPVHRSKNDNTGGAFYAPGSGGGADSDYGESMGDEEDMSGSFGNGYDDGSYDDGGDDDADDDGYGDGDGDGGIDDPRRQTNNYQLGDGTIINEDSKVYNILSKPGNCTNRYQLATNEIIEFTPTQMQKIKKLYFDGNSLKGFDTDDFGNEHFDLSIAVKLRDDEIVQRAMNYQFVCFKCIERDYATLSTSSYNTEIKHNVRDAVVNSFETVYTHYPPDDLRYCFTIPYGTNVFDCGEGMNVMAITESQPYELYCRTLKKEDCFYGSTLDRDDKIYNPIGLHLNHHSNLPEWARKFCEKIGKGLLTQCNSRYINDRLDELHKSDAYAKEPDPYKRDEIETFALGYYWVFGSLYCATDEASVIGSSELDKYAAGILHEAIGIIDVVALTDGLGKIANGLGSNVKTNIKFFIDEAKQACIDQVNTGTIDYEGILTRIVQKDAKDFNSTYTTVKTIANHFSKMYFTGCGNDPKYGDICSYRYGQITMMALPIVVSGGQWLALKAPKLLSGYISKTKEALDLLKASETAGKVIEDIAAIENGAGDVATTIINEADNKTVTTIFNDVTSVEMKAAFLHATEADLAAINNVTTNALGSGGRSITGVDKLVNAREALVLQPQKGTALEQKVLDYMQTQTTGSATTAQMGQTLEDVAEQVAKEINPTGLNVNFKTNGSGNGFDVLSVKYDAAGNVEKIYIFESKPLTNGTRIELPTTTFKGDQMSTQWINQTIDDMRVSSQMDIKNMGDLLKANNTKIERFVATVDRKLKQAVIVRLDIF